MPDREPNRELIRYLNGRYPYPARTNAKKKRAQTDDEDWLDPRTLEPVLKTIRPVTIETLARHYAERHALRAAEGDLPAGPVPSITPEMLYMGYDGLFPPDLADALEPYRRVCAPPGPQRVETAAHSCPVFATQYEAEAEFFRRFERMTTPTPAAAALVDFSCHVVRPFIQRLLHGSRVGRLDVLMGTPEAARAVGSARQAALIHHHKHSEFDTDLLTSGRVTLTQFSSPPTFRGFHVAGVAVCVGWYFWFPLCQGLDGGDPRVRSVLDDLAGHGIVPPKIDDPYTLDGHDMPHLLAFRPSDDAPGSPYAALARVFDLHVRTMRGYADLAGMGAGNMNRPTDSAVG